MADMCNRREFLKGCSALTAGSLLAGTGVKTFCSQEDAAPRGTLLVDPQPRFEISPHFYMQFMEPLGITEPSVEAAWDFGSDGWREDVISCVSDLGPDVIRWPGGGFTRYYKWREGVGSVDRRPSMYNIYWGGMETNRVGTHEYVDFCRRTGSEPLVAVNFESDGIKSFARTSRGKNRVGDAREAADWVSYANDPDNRERLSHGHRDPYGIQLWQLGNETSYNSAEAFTAEQAAAKTVEFAKAMRKRDPSIRLIGWGDVTHPQKFHPGTPPEDPGVQPWARTMLESAGEDIDYIAWHMMGVYPEPGSLLHGFEYQRDPRAAWELLLGLANSAEHRVNVFRDQLKKSGSSVGMAVTEGHLSLNPYNTSPLLTEWLSASYHARVMNTYLRHGDVIKICTGADFFGPRWTVNAVRIVVPRGGSFLLPIGSIMRLYKRYGGRRGIKLAALPEALDAAATRRGDTLCLHVLNTRYDKAVRVTLAVKNARITGGRVYEIAPDEPRAHVDQTHREIFEPMEKTLPPGPTPDWTFPARSVSVVQLDISV